MIKHRYQRRCQRLSVKPAENEEAVLNFSTDCERAYIQSLEKHNRMLTMETAFEARSSRGVGAEGGVAFPDTVSQPLASFQRPGRVYHADDYAPGAQRQAEPRLVRPPSMDVPMGQEVGPGTAPIANGGSWTEAGASDRFRTQNEATNGPTEQPSQPSRQEAKDELCASLPIPTAESKPLEHPPRSKPPPPIPPPAKRQRVSERTVPLAQSAASAADLPTPAPIPPVVTDVTEPESAPLSVPPAEESPTQGVWRKAEALAQCLACDICCEVLQDPVTCSTCMHCYCRDCIDAFLMPGGNSNCCPVCQCGSVATSLGQNPYKDHLKMDFVLESLVRKACQSALPSPPPVSAPPSTPASSTLSPGLSGTQRSF